MGRKRAYIIGLLAYAVGAAAMTLSQSVTAIVVFWAVIGGTEAEGDVGKVVAVVANGVEFTQQLTQLEGLSAIVKGTRLEGASTRMAGPEITATSVVAASDAAGPAA